MKVLAILGSPRVNKNTDILLNEVIKGIRKCTNDITKYELKKIRINPCIACYKCGDTGKCTLDDDMQKLYKEFDNSDVIIVASPLYFNSVSSLTKIMIDRCQAFWSSKYILNNSSIDRCKERKGIFICTAGAKQNDDGFVGALVVMDLFFRSINADYYKNLLVDNTDKIFVQERKDVLRKAYEIGESLCNI
ncbi:MAG: hypothetical protein PWQ37_976 [Candidatus Petromonas sp.]|nr:hypothetical protein [Candidatus Petromonas sp.]